MGSPYRAPWNPTTERILIVGHGYAGARFLRAFRHLAGEGYPVEVTGLCDTDAARWIEGVAGFESLEEALHVGSPTVVCVATNEENHSEVYQTLQRAPRLLVLSEKPLVTTHSEVSMAVAHIGHHAFSMNMVERFSPAVDSAKRWLATVGPFRLLRAESFWGKHRIHDSRPTMGVLSEAIHPLDLIRHVFGIDDLRIIRAAGTSSDFSPHGDATLDSVDVHALSDGAPILLHSSYVWPQRQRTLAALVKSQSTGQLFRMHFVFDTPHWDNDSFEVQVIDDAGRYQVSLREEWNGETEDSLLGIGKVIEFTRRSLAWWRDEGIGEGLVDLNEAVRLQSDLSTIADALTNSTYQGRYFRR